jgi:competence protein ComEA
MKRLRKGWLAGLCVSLGPVSAFAGPVNINTADARTLAEELVGVGPALAKAIVLDREQNGEFSSPDALARVKGIGSRIVEQNKRNILIDASPASP